jgi:hypothetical protein
VRDKLLTAAEVTFPALVPLGAGVQWGIGIGLIVAGVVGFGVTVLASLGGKS